MCHPLAPLVVLAGIWATGPAQPPGGRPPAAKHLYPLKSGKLWGYIDAKGETVIPPRFDHAFPFAEGLAAVLKDGTWSFIDQTGAVKFDAPCQADLHGFEGGFARGSIGLGFHYFDRRGRLLPGRFAGTREFSEWLAAVYIDPERFKPRPPGAVTWPEVSTGKWGFIDATGELVIPARFTAAGRFSNGLAPVYVGGQDRMCTGLDGGRWGYIDRKGNLVIAPKFDSARPFSDGVAWVGVARGEGHRREHLYGYIGPDGEYVISPRKYFGAHDFHEGLAAVRGTDHESPDFPRDFGFIDKKGNVAIPARFAGVEEFSEGLAVAQDQSTWDEKTKSWVSGRLGYINKRGEWVVRPQYDGTGKFVGGLATVGTPEGFGYIDRRGRRVAWSPK